MANGPLTSPFQARPSALTAPVPTEEERQQAEAATQAATPTQALSPEQEDELLNQFLPPIDPGDQLQQPQALSVEDEQALLDQLLGPQGAPAVQPGSALDFIERAKLSFAQTETEQRSFLESIPGVTNVEFEDGEPIVTRNGQRKRVDPEDFEFFADLFADIARPAVEAAVELPITAAGALAGTAAAPGPGTAAGLIGAGAVGGAAATNLGDLIQEAVIGIERDPERSRLVETGLSAALGGTLNLIGGKVAGSLARRQAVKAVQQANQAAVNTLPDFSREFVRATRDLQELGLESTVQGIDGEPLRFLVTNLDVETPQIRNVVNELASNPQFQKLQKDLGDTAIDNVNQILRSVGDTQGIGQLDEAVGQGQIISRKVSDFVTDLKAQEGAKIGEFKKKLAREATTGQIAEASTDRAMIELFRRAGVRRRGDELLNLTPEALGENLIVNDSPALRKFTSEVRSIAEKLTNKGELNLQELERGIKRLEPLFKAKMDPPLRVELARLSSALRRDRIAAVEQALPDAQKGAFREAMGRFRNISQATDQVSELLTRDPIATNAFVKSIFNKGKEGLADLRAAKGLLEAENPQLWREVVGEFFNETIRDVTESGTKAPSVAKFFSKLRGKVSDDGIKLLFEGADFSANDFRKAILVGKQIEKTFQKATDTQKEELIKQGIGITSPFRNARLNAFKNIFSSLIFRNSEAKRFLTQRGLDEFLLGIPANERGRLKKMIDAALKISTDVRTVEPARLGAEAALREEVREQ